MAGLLDFLSSPESQLGLGLLAAAGSGQRFGPGLLSAVQYSNEARRAADDQSFQKRQRDQQTKAWDLQDQESALAPQFLRSGGGGSLSSFDMQGYANAVMGVNPLRGMQLLQSLQKEIPVDKIDPTKFTPESLAKFAQSRNYGDLMPRDKLEFVEGVGVNPFDPNNANRAIPNPNKPFQMDAQGNILTNKAYQNYEISKASAGAARTSNNISVNTEKSFLNEIAKGAGSQLDASLAGAKGAQSTIGTLNNLDAAINSGKVMAGPLTAPAQVLMQVGTQLGLNGKSSKETLEKTRAAMQAMAQLELDAASQMKGQGQITESERAILRKAASGDISMSIGEIQTLSKVARKTAENRIRQHNQNVQPLLSNPNAGALAPFLTVPQPEAAQAPAGGGVVDFSSLK
jgi:hypothetical protein